MVNCLQTKQLTVEQDVAHLTQRLDGIVFGLQGWIRDVEANDIELSNNQLYLKHYLTQQQRNQEQSQSEIINLQTTLQQLQTSQFSYPIAGSFTAEANVPSYQQLPPPIALHDGPSTNTTTYYDPGVRLQPPALLNTNACVPATAQYSYPSFTQVSQMAYQITPLQTQPGFTLFAADASTSYDSPLNGNSVSTMSYVPQPYQPAMAVSTLQTASTYSQHTVDTISLQMAQAQQSVASPSLCVDHNPTPPPVAVENNAGTPPVANSAAISQFQLHPIPGDAKTYQDAEIQVDEEDMRYPDETWTWPVHHDHAHTIFDLHDELNDALLNDGEVYLMRYYFNVGPYPTADRHPQPPYINKFASVIADEISTIVLAAYREDITANTLLNQLFRLLLQTHAALKIRYDMQHAQGYDASFRHLAYQCAFRIKIRLLQKMVTTIRSSHWIKFPQAMMAVLPINEFVSRYNQKRIRINPTEHLALEHQFVQLRQRGVFGNNPAMLWKLHHYYDMVMNPPGVGQVDPLEHLPDAQLAKYRQDRHDIRLHLLSFVNRLREPYIQAQQAYGLEQMANVDLQALQLQHVYPQFP